MILERLAERQLYVEQTLHHLEVKYFNNIKFAPFFFLKKKIIFLFLELCF